MNKNIIPTELTFIERAGIFFWRNIFLDLVYGIRGKNYPVGKLTEYAYGDLPDEKLDFITPNNLEEKQIAIIHIHGGAWIGGCKGAFYSKPLIKFSNAGYPIFSLNYPLAPEHPHPHVLRSLLKALAWIKQNYPQYKTIHLIGDSAGGNLATMLGIFISNPNLLKKLDNIHISLLPTIKTVVNIYGINDRITWIEDGFPSAKLFLKAYAGEKAIETNFVSDIPITPMDFKNFENLPPTFIIGAEKDKLLNSSKIWAEHLSKKFNYIDLKIYEGANHGFFSFGKGCDELSDDMLIFFNRN